MNLRNSRALGAIVLCAAAFAVLLVAPVVAGAKTTTAKLRVLTPTKVLDPGTTYVVGPEKVKTDPNADCNFGGQGGSGQTYPFETPTALSLLQAGAEGRGSLNPLSITDEFGFGLAICGIGAVDDQESTFWYLKKNHQELAVGADQEPVSKGDELLIYLAPDNFPAPNPPELELTAVARAVPGDELTVSAIQHSCTTDPNTFEVTCASAPAEGVTVSGGSEPVTTGADGTATVIAADGKKMKLAASRADSIPAEVLSVCLDEDLSSCPAKRGERIVGRNKGDRIKGTKGADVIRARGGNDRIDVRSGGPDRIDCGSGKDRVRGGVDPVKTRGCERVIVSAPPAGG
jgi:hypothetical protein